MNEHKIFDVILAGLLDYKNGTPSKIDDYGYYEGPYYETGRHLAAHLIEQNQSLDAINISNIHQTYNKFREELYGERSRKRIKSFGNR